LLYLFKCTEVSENSDAFVTSFQSTLSEGVMYDASKATHDIIKGRKDAAKKGGRGKSSTSAASDALTSTLTSRLDSLIAGGVGAAQSLEAKANAEMAASQHEELLFNQVLSLMEKLDSGSLSSDVEALVRARLVHLQAKLASAQKRP